MRLGIVQIGLVLIILGAVAPIDIAVLLYMAPTYAGSNLWDLVFALLGPGLSLAVLGSFLPPKASKRKPPAG